jgi:hypothetical protein
LIPSSGGSATNLSGTAAVANLPPHNSTMINSSLLMLLLLLVEGAELMLRPELV